MYQSCTTGWNERSFQLSFCTFRAPKRAGSEAIGVYENCHAIRDGAILIYTRPGRKKTTWQRVLFLTTDIVFYKMRAYAEFVGVPTGVLLVYTQLASEEAEQPTQSMDRAAALAHLRKMIEAMNALDTYIGSKKRGSALHNAKQDEEGLKFQVKIGGLLAMSKAYKSNPDVDQ